MSTLFQLKTRGKHTQLPNFSTLSREWIFLPSAWYGRCVFHHQCTERWPFHQAFRNRLSLHSPGLGSISSVTANRVSTSAQQQGKLIRLWEAGDFTHTHVSRAQWGADLCPNSATSGESCELAHFWWQQGSGIGSANEVVLVGALFSPGRCQQAEEEIEVAPPTCSKALAVSLYSAGLGLARPQETKQTPLWPSHYTSTKRKPAKIRILNRVRILLI